MLQSLSIKNLALIKNENIEFTNGLNIILGETGAGKSLLFEAMFFVLGLKTDKSLIRSGEESMRVDILFSNPSQAIKNELENMEIEDCDELLISRTLNTEGRSSVKINGNIATLSSLKTLSKLLVDTLVQHESLELLKTKNHLVLLDSYIGEDATTMKQNLTDILSKISAISKKIDDLGGDKEERERRKDILLYQIEEIEKAEITIGEDEEIEQKLKLLDSAEKIKETLSYVLGLISNSDKGAVSQINDAYRQLNSLSNIEKINELQERLGNAKYEVEDISEELHDIFSSSNFDEIEYNRLDRRKDQLKALKKKYGASLDLVLEYYNKVKAQYDDISGSEITIEKLNKEKSHLETEANDIAQQLSQIRKSVAKDVTSEVVNELKDLGMKGTRFEIKFEDKNLSTDGKDDVVFNFSANVGQEVKNIAKTASGGEMSRIMLALKNIFKGTENKTLLFDEVDAGISGETGNMIALKLRNIAEREQIICITHLPQVAGAGHNFIKVEKEVVEAQTVSNSSILIEEDIPFELARLMGGKAITETALSHARELRNKFIHE